MKHTIDELIDRAVRVVHDAGDIALRYFRSRMKIDDKHSRGVFDPVTEADRRIEKFIREALSSVDPGLAVIGEEYGRSGDGDSYWIVDPIDGTRAFICGVPLWGILVGLVIDGVPVGSVMYQPFTGETYISDSSGPRLFHRNAVVAIRTSACRSVSEAIAYSLDPRLIERANLMQPFSRLMEQCRMLRWGGDCYSFAMVALGCVDLVVEAGLEPYDVVPLIHLVESAGGVVTDLNGVRPMNGGIVVAAANRELHEAALTIFHESAA
ncbi:inositol monophosphatase family protein [Burkholderia pseudomultivorans]|uniref:Histidinol-phosphatase n=1 Tax=Burkholderia pseudomultivorans TaxID=1207504 RepID=A0A6P2MU99_9BURK|nr:inositol monophosphatase family protein [Burkholderia pseudomultivorans]MDR8730123.1 Histidinol-phosphatase [Burkholderia pseudomultivorans]MDR8734708.1 Histidinol-phosphatase [Burkholderia pseudomultivorans]MDR8740674.1 Histidinol-phosphatase [Burkholderia pseudomultivorans]MDR8751661.1 Histidinol-phosphatase [Burkholderia pseudomultivorans]MDR8777088.1 Histidinol-phosphatase [Burkholderia pseudomultivorans]